ncbi:expressed unknown protein [Seminavis robusta]|uniref:Uncharacterized protein n=1 Tax=Seminavis robusta TaxID=568900 RepID=A0A9N8HHV3_9STRA|nr:expressed unknown protein [Seminavis robusta]|eukprot:Sro466_g148740.1 n/a (182) ;mRNA; f:8068-8613
MNCRIRERYFNKLGILPNGPPPAHTVKKRRSPTELPGTVCGASSSSNRQRHQADQPPPPPPSPIVVERRDDEQPTPRQPRSPPQVQFHTCVSVIEIPSHRDYDRASRRNIWNSPQVLEQNVQRNTYEYWAEGLDWRNATEEKDMIRTRKGRLVHPATWKLIHENIANQHKNRRRAMLHRQA